MTCASQFCFCRAHGTLAEIALLEGVVAELGASATLLVTPEADHSFHVPARGGTTDAQVMEGILDSAASWMRRSHNGHVGALLHPAPLASSDRGPPVEALAGLVERVTFHNADSGFCVLRVKARGQRDLVTVVGHAASIAAGEWVQMSGTWINDRTHGLQFKAAFLKASPPTTLEGIEKYLGSGMIRGIGPVYATKLVRAFGAAVFELIEQEPARLREVTGIGPKRAARIIAGWAEQKVIREIMLFLHANGVGTSRAVRIYKTYGAEAVQVITENPYRLARDIRGIGFRTADVVAQKLGIEPTASIRVRAGISFALAEASGEGHCGLPVEELTTLAGKLLEVSAELIEAALVLELDAGEVVADTLDGRRVRVPGRAVSGGAGDRRAPALFWPGARRLGHRSTPTKPFRG